MEFISSCAFALLYEWWTSWSVHVIWNWWNRVRLSRRRHRCIWICHKGTWKMSITDKLSNSFLINYHQPHSGRNLITLFSLNYHQSLCQQWFVFQEGPLLKPRDIVFTSQFLPRWNRGSFLSNWNFLQCSFPLLVSAYENMKTGCKWWRWFNLNRQDGCFKSNIKTNSTALWLRLTELLPHLVALVFTQYHS